MWPIVKHARDILKISSVDAVLMGKANINQFYSLEIYRRFDSIFQIKNNIFPQPWSPLCLAYVSSQSNGACRASAHSL